MAQEHSSIRFADLIASSVHDMKNALSVQVGVLERVAQQRRAAGDQASYQVLGGAIHESQRMHASLVQLLGLYKLGQAIYPLDIAECAMAELLGDLLAQQQFMLEVKNIAVQLDCEPDCQWYVDRDLVSGALLNALHNACAHSRGKIRIAARTDQGRLQLRVEDDGPGFPAHLLQADAETARMGVDFAGGSTGLGLHFALQVARVHKNGTRVGGISLENGGAYGGACFVLHLP